MIGRSCRGSGFFDVIGSTCNQAGAKDLSCLIGSKFRGVGGVAEFIGIHEVGKLGTGLILEDLEYRTFQKALVLSITLDDLQLIHRS